MSNSTRVLVVGSNELASDQPDFDRELLDRGFDIRRSDVATASNLWAATRSDVVILDMLAATAAGERDVFRSLAERLKRSGLSGHRPVIAIADPDRSAELGDTVRDADDVLYAPLTAAEVVSRIDALRRLTIMQSELTRRVETAAKFGIDLPDIAPPGAICDANVLVVGAPTHFLSLETALAPLAVLTGAFTADTACDYLARRDFDALIVTMDAPSAEAFISGLRRNPSHATLPIIALSDTTTEVSASALYTAGASDVLPTDTRRRDLPTRVETLIREHRFRKRLTQVYRDVKRQPICDALSGLFSRGFLMEHLARVIDDAERWSEPLTAATFSVANIAEINAAHGFAAGDHAIQQAGAILGRVLRGEDLAARWDGARFAAIFPSSAAENAKVAVDRAAAIIAGSRFAAEDPSESVAIDLWTGIAHFEPGDDAASLMGRALADLRL